MPRTQYVLFDVNGTLTDLSPIGSPWDDRELGQAVLDTAVETAMADALLGTADRPFSDHLRAALQVLVARRGLDPGGIEAALSQAAALPARPDAAAALARLTSAGVGVIALTNSGAAAGVETLRAAGIVEHFDHVLGVDAVKTFKPHPRVYEYALRELNADVSRTALVATHPWDLAGATRAGITTAWVTHGARAWPAVFPPPDARGDSLLEVVEALLHWPAATTESEVSPLSQG